MAAASLKAPGSPWKATRMVLRSVVIMAMRYLAIGHGKRKAAAPAARAANFAGLFAPQNCLANLEFCRESQGESRCAGEAGKAIIAPYQERCPHEEARDWRIRGILREVHCQGSGYGGLEHSRIRAAAHVAFVRRTLRARRKFLLRAWQMDDQGSSRAHLGCRANFHLQGAAHRPVRSDAARSEER